MGPSATLSSLQHCTQQVTHETLMQDPRHQKRSVVPADALIFPQYYSLWWVQCILSQLQWWIGINDLQLFIDSINLPWTFPLSFLPELPADISLGPVSEHQWQYPFRLFLSDAVIQNSRYIGNISMVALIVFFMFSCSLSTPRNLHLLIMNVTHFTDLYSIGCLRFCHAVIYVCVETHLMDFKPTWFVLHGAFDTIRFSKAVTIVMAV